MRNRVAAQIQIGRDSVINLLNSKGYPSFKVDIFEVSLMLLRLQESAADAADTLSQVSRFADCSVSKAEERRRRSQLDLSRRSELE